MAREPNVVAKGTDSKTTREPAKPKVTSQEAKDLRTLIATLSEKNSPDTSKDITAYAKQTLKVVAQSQKSESAAFRREATKALVDFRSFVEKTDKVNEARRAKLLGDIDKTALDAKSASFMMLSIAKEQAKSIKETAIQTATAEKIRIKQLEKSMLTEAELKSKAMVKEAKQKSKALTEEQTAKMKAISVERKQKYEELVANAKASIQAKKDSLKAAKDAAKTSNDTKRAKLTADKDAHKAKVAADAIQLKQDRADAAAKISKLKTDLRDDYKTKVTKQKIDAADAKANIQTRTKNRMQKLKLIAEEQKIKIKKMQESAKAENIINKMKIKEEVQEINDEARKRKAKHEKNAGDLTGKVKDGIYDANPVIHAAVEMASGIIGHLGKRMGDKKKDKALNKLASRNPTSTATPNPTPNATPVPPATPPAAAGGSEGPSIFGGIASMIAMLPSFGSVIGGIISFVKEIGSIGKTMGKMLGGAKAIPVIGTMIAVITAVWDFVDGFNNASALFGEELGDGNYVKKIFAGFVGVVTGILDIFDHVAGWFGFETDLKGKYEKAAVAIFNFMGDMINSIVDTVKGIFNSVMGAVRAIAGGIGAVLSYIPGAGAAATALNAFAKGGIQPKDAPAPAAAIQAKQGAVNDLKDQVDAKKSGAGAVQVNTDNSVKTNSTTIVQPKLDTRNSDSSVNRYGYGGVLG